MVDLISLSQRRGDMSHSFKKTPITGLTTADSEAYSKRLWARRFRKHVKDELLKGGDQDSLKDRRELGNVYSGEKDGKQIFNPEKHPGLLRK